MIHFTCMALNRVGLRAGDNKKSYSKKQAPQLLSDYSVQVRVVNNFVVASSVEFGCCISAGTLNPTTAGGVEVSASSIGRAVLKVFSEIQKNLDVRDSNHIIESEHGNGLLSQLDSIGNTASYLGISASSVRRLIEKGKLHSVRTEGGHRRVYRWSVKRVAQEQLNLSALRTKRTGE